MCRYPIRAAASAENSAAVAHTVDQPSCSPAQPAATGPAMAAAANKADTTPVILPVDCSRPAAFPLGDRL